MATTLIIKPKAKQMEASIEVKKVAVIALISAQILHETLDELRYTSLYKGKLKTATDQFETQLTVHCDKHINVLYATSEESARALQQGIEQIAKTIATMDPYDVIKLAELVKERKIQYEENDNEAEIKRAEPEFAEN